MLEIVKKKCTLNSSILFISYMLCINSDVTLAMKSNEKDKESRVEKTIIVSK